MRNPQYTADGEGSDQRKLVQEPQHYLTFNINDNIEILSRDNGLRGCWFRCKILCMSQTRLRVQYCDVLDDESVNLEEWVPLQGAANLDELGMRHVGRLTIRTLPSEDKSVSSKFSVCSALDAWWCGGWWEDVLIGYETSSLNNLQPFLSGEKKFVTIKRKNVRASKDWIDAMWMSITPNPSILFSINSFWKN